MRKAKIDPKVVSFGVTITNYKSHNISCWTHACHKPYANDWKEAREKAYDKMDTLGLNSDGDFYNMMREKGTRRLREALRNGS